MRSVLLSSLVLLFATLVPTTAWSQDDDRTPADYTRLSPSDPIFEDLYVQLYLARVEQQRLEIEKHRQDLGVNVANRERMERLYVRDAVSASELESARRDAEVSALNVSQSQARLRESEALLNIAIDRVSIGLEMPICATLQ